MSDSLQPHGIVAYQASLPMELSRQHMGMGRHFLLQGIFPTQGSNPCPLSLLHWQVDSLPLHHLGSPLSSLLILIVLMDS